MDYSMLSRDELVVRVRVIRKSHEHISLSSSKKYLVAYLTKYDNIGLSMVLIEIVGKIACMLDNVSFMRFVAAYPALARDVAKNPNYYQSAFADYERLLLCGRNHSFDDTPISTSGCGRCCWYKYGRYHRDYLPAIEGIYYSMWYQNNYYRRPSGLFTKRENLTYIWTDGNGDTGRGYNKPAMIKYDPKLKENPNIENNSELALIFHKMLAWTDNLYFGQSNIIDDLFNTRLSNGLRLVDDLDAMYLLFDMHILKEQYIVQCQHHRTDGPARITDGIGSWFIHDKQVASPTYLRLDKLEILNMEDITNDVVMELSNNECSCLIKKIQKRLHKPKDKSEIL